MMKIEEIQENNQKRIKMILKRSKKEQKSSG